MTMYGFGGGQLWDFERIESYSENYKRTLVLPFFEKSYRLNGESNSSIVIGSSMVYVFGYDVEVKLSLNEHYQGTLFSEYLAKQQRNQMQGDNTNVTKIIPLKTE